MGADGAAQKARHQDRAEDGGGRDGVKDGAGEDDRTHDTGQVHREPGFLQHARDLRRREKLNSAVCHQSDNDNRAHDPAGPMGAMQGHGFRRPMQVHGFRHLSFSKGVTLLRGVLLTVSLECDKHRGIELTVLSMENNSKVTKMQNLEPLLIFITVAEMGSFTRAADSLGIQKGRASTAVRKLEEDVGVRLLHRTTRSVQLTEDGRGFSCPCPRSACRSR